MQRFRSNGITDLIYASLAYDAVWTIATALSDVLLFHSELHRAVTESDFPGVSVNIHHKIHTHAQPINLECQLI